MLISEPEVFLNQRHARSDANVACQKAREQGLEEIPLTVRDADVSLAHPVGYNQAELSADWFWNVVVPIYGPPAIIVSSSHRRAIETTLPIINRRPVRCPRPLIRIDPRLREADPGIFENLTPLGVLRRYPEEHAKREHIGRFRYRPPGGESWQDVVERVRDFRQEVGREFAGRVVLAVNHSIVTICFRYDIEGLTEEQAMAIWNVPNCGITAYTRTESGLILDRAYLVAPGLPTIDPLQDKED